MILLDERVLASFGGGIRRQWRVDYLSVPAEHTEVSFIKSYFASIYTPGWDGGYGVARLDALGVYEIVAAQEAFMRSRYGTVRTIEQRSGVGKA